MKIYNKRGVPNFKERPMVAALKEYFEKNPDEYKNYTPANNSEELKQYYDHFITEDAEIVSETINKTEAKEETHESFRNGFNPEPELFPQDDPMNRSSPKIRDYVLDDGFQDENKKEETKSNYEEPKSFRDSFSLPDDNIQSDKHGNNNNNGQPLNSKPKQPNAPPDPDAKVKRKSKKKFTKYAVDAVCALASRGIVWYSTKDITADKLAEMVANDEISQSALDLLVYIDANTQGTVKQFFANRVETAIEFAQFTLEEKEDLAEALEDFLEYKKIEINPTINIAVVFLGMLFDRALKAITLRAETNSILMQLKNMHVSTEDQDYSDPAAHQSPQTANHDPAAEATDEEEKSVQTTETKE